MFLYAYWRSSYLTESGWGLGQRSLPRRAGIREGRVCTFLYFSGLCVIEQYEPLFSSVTTLHRAARNHMYLLKK